MSESPCTSRCSRAKSREAVSSWKAIRRGAEAYERDTGSHPPEAARLGSVRKAACFLTRSPIRTRRRACLPCVILRSAAVLLPRGSARPDREPPPPSAPGGGDPFRNGCRAREPKASRGLAVKEGGRSRRAPPRAPRDKELAVRVPHAPRSRLRHRLTGAAAPERALDLPARGRLRRPHQPHDHADHAQQQPGREPGPLAVALAVGQPRRGNSGRQPDEEQVQTGDAQQANNSHAPRYAFWTSGFSFRRSDLSEITTAPVSST